MTIDLVLDLAAERAANAAWLTLEAVVALLTTGQDTALLLEVGHADGGQGGSGVVLGRVVVHLVDGDGGVDDVWLDGFCRIISIRIFILSG